MTYSTFKCWRLYSCSLFTWMSKSDCGSTLVPVRPLMNVASARLLSSFTVCHSARKPLSLAKGSRRRNSSSRLETQPSPMRLVMSALSFGLLNTIQRRGVTPLVTLKNLSGDTA